MRVAATVLAVACLALARGPAALAQGTARDVRYGTDPLQRLDLALPGTRGFATVIFVHGGSLTSGDKADDDYRAVCTPFVAAGIGCASINYRLGPVHRWPAQIQDVATATRWVTDSIGTRGGDPRRVFLFGHSSGATLVALLATDARYLSAVGLSPRSLRGVIPMGSIMEDLELERALTRVGRERVAARVAADPDYATFGHLDAYEEYWPMRRLRAVTPPLLFLIAEAEQVNPPILASNRRFVDSARALGSDAELQVLPDRTHTSAIRRLGEPGDPAFNRIRDFITAHR